MNYVAEMMNAVGCRTGAFGKLRHHPVTGAKGFPDDTLMEEGRLGAKSPCCRWLMEHHPDAAGDLHVDGSSFCFEEESYYKQWTAGRALDFIRDGDDTHFGRPYWQGEEPEVAV